MTLEGKTPLTRDPVLQYVKHFPKAEKFVSLMKQADDPTAQEALDAERARLRALVRKQLAENALLAEVNEGQPLVASGTLAGEVTSIPSDRLLLVLYLYKLS